MSKLTVPLSAPITIGNVQASSLLVSSRFQIGWLRDAPDTPDFFISAIKGVVGALPWKDLDALKKMTDQEIVDLVAGNFPMPTGTELSATIKWLLHIAEKATEQPAAVVDQLGLGDLWGIFKGLMPGMIALANFRTTSGDGVVISPGSSTGAPKPSTG